jgi:murein DD-endopeptidase MepM/ murein hydrolase activator NlpD
MIKSIPQKFNVLIVANKKSAIKKMEVKRSHLALASFVVVALVVGIIFSSVGFLHYRQAFLAAEGLRVEAAKYQRESSAIFAKLQALENILKRSMRFSAKILTHNNERENLLMARGPIDEGDWRASLEGSQEGYNHPASQWQSSFKPAYEVDFNFKIDQLLGRVAGLEKTVHAALLSQRDRLFFWSSIPSIWPSKGWITSKFGASRYYGRRVGGRHARWHEGIDIAAPRGTPIMVSADGIVTYTGYKSGYGKTVKIDHGNGFTTIYAHCSSIFVKEGDEVMRGMIIAAVGNTGRSTGPHLHYEVRIDDVPVDPIQYVVGEM